MCIAIYKPKGTVIEKKTLEQCFKANPDGAGFMYNHNKELVSQKGFFTFDQFYEAYKEHESKQTVIHFRIKTHGQINEENCHPFLINNSLGFVHNGVISGYFDINKSDTNLFNEQVLQPLVDKWGNLSLFQPAIKGLIENRIGFSKLIFLDRHGNHNIFNEAKGIWDHGVWYSNSSYLEPKPFNLVPYTPYKSYGTKPKQPKPYLSISDIVKLNRAHYDSETKTIHKAGTEWEVIAINKNFTADLMTMDDEAEDNVSFLYNIEFIKLDLVLDEEEPFTNQNYAGYSNWSI